MSKAYLSVEEACQVLGIEQDQLMEHAKSGKLQMYRDGNKDLFKGPDIEALAEELGLSVAPDLSAADAPAASQPKEDSVITAEGISIFDDEDLEIDEADPRAKTQIAPSLDDQIALEGVGSGSGLLDLTRESDDTSLGPVLDDMEGITGSGLGSGLIEAGLSSGLEGMTSSGGISSGGMGLDSTEGQLGGTVRVETETVFIEEDESTDAISGMFTGLLVGAAIIMMIVLAVALAAQRQAEPRFLTALHGNMSILLVAVIVVTLIAGGAGYLVGKAFQQNFENGNGNGNGFGG